MTRLRRQTRPLAALALANAVALAAGATHAQTVLYNNGGSGSTPALATGPLTASGVAAPAGAQWSEAQAQFGVANAVGGFATQVLTGGGGYRFADDLSVPGPDAWSISRLSFFAYQPNAADVSSPFDGLNIRIWTGPPGEIGSVVVFGDTGLNRLVEATPEPIYRVFSTAVFPFDAPPGTTRRVWRVSADVTGLVLTPGTYWVDWQFTSALPGGEAFAPPVTLNGLRNTPNANARQFRTDEDLWAPAIDPGKPASAADLAQELPFIVLGEVVPGPCLADFTGDTALNDDDLGGFVTAYFESFAGPGGYAVTPCPGVDAPFDTLGYRADFTRDCSLNDDDLGAFLTSYFLGCN